MPPERVELTDFPSTNTLRRMNYKFVRQRSLDGSTNRSDDEDCELQEGGHGEGDSAPLINGRRDTDSTPLIKLNVEVDENYDGNNSPGVCGQMNVEGLLNSLGASSWLDMLLGTTEVKVESDSDDLGFEDYMIDESKVTGVQAPDGTSFLAYLGNYRIEFDKVSRRILKKRQEHASRPQLSASQFFNSDHHIDGVLISRISDLEDIYRKHQCTLMCGICIDFVINAEFLLMWAKGRPELYGLSENLKEAPSPCLLHFYHFLFLAWVVWSVLYYMCGLLASVSKGPPEMRHKHLRRLSNLALAGIGMIIMGEFVRKFNLVLFFLRLVIHLFSKFLLTLNQHFFLTNSGNDVYQLLATTVPTDTESMSDEEYAATRQAIIESQLEAERAVQPGAEAVVQDV